MTKIKLNKTINNLIKMLIIFGFPLVCYHHPKLILYLLSVYIMWVILEMIEETKIKENNV